MTDHTLELKQIEQRLLWLSAWTVHNANHLRQKDEFEVKVGGHQASCASMVSIMTALYFHALRPEDRVAVKPHASPVFHAMQYLMDNQTQENLENFRGFGGAQSYPSRTKDIDDVDFSTGSVGLGVAITAFASLVQDYLHAKGLMKTVPPGRMIALVGDAELDEGNVYECLQEGWKHDLRNTWWIIDYNRQSLDGVVHEGLWERVEGIFHAFGWNVVRLRFGALQRATFERPGGQALREWIESCPNSLYSALTFKGGAAWRERLSADLGDQGPVSALIDSFSDDELADLMNNLGGQCVETLCEAFDQADDDTPTVFLAYTIKGWGTPLAGHKDNHAGLMTPKQMQAFQTDMQVPAGREWDKFLDPAQAKTLQPFLDQVSFFKNGMRRYSAPRVETGGPVFLKDEIASTQAGFGKILDNLAKSDSPIVDRILTTSPDVTVSTNLGGWVNRRGLFAREAADDVFRQEQIPSTQKWGFTPQGQHIELGIAEMNLFLLLGAAGLSDSLFGERLIPVGTVYDPFVARGLDALNYACYQDARFIIAGTPSGVTLAPEGGAHQSIGIPMIGMSQDGLTSYEPAYLDELSVIMDWGFQHVQDEDDGGALYLRLSTRPTEQLQRDRDVAFQNGVIEGGYWLRKPGPKADIVIAYQGCVAPEAIAAAGRIGGTGRDVGVLAVTSADKLYKDWLDAQNARMRGDATRESAIETLMADVPSHALLITVVDAHPAGLSWIGGVAGHRVAPLGVDHFGQTGTVADLYRYFGIDADSIVAVANRSTIGMRPRLSAV